MKFDKENLTGDNLTIENIILILYPQIFLFHPTGRRNQKGELTSEIGNT